MPATTLTPEQTRHLLDLMDEIDQLDDNPTADLTRLAQLETAVQKLMS